MSQYILSLGLRAGVFTLAMNPKVSRWNSERGPLSEDTMRQLLMSEGYNVSKYDYPPAMYFSPHTHPMDKKDTVLRGHLRIGWEGGYAVLGPGDMIEIPAGFSHSAEVVGPETVVSLDATRRQ